MVWRITATAALICVALASLNSCGGGKHNNLDSQAGLQAKLEQALSAEFERLGIDPEKVTAAAPSGNENRVFDFGAKVLDPDGPGGAPPSGVQLTWTERLTGDYDQNGEVGISDLTPLGANFLSTVRYDSPAVHLGQSCWPWGCPQAGGAGLGAPPQPGSPAHNWRLYRIDGDLNGELNMSDITPLATHWEQRLDGYRIYRTRPGDTGFAMLPNPDNPAQKYTVDAGQTEAGYAVSYYFVDTDLGGSPGGYWEYYVAPYDGASDSEGPPSNYAGVPMDQGQTGGYGPVAILTADVASGSHPLDVHYDAGGSYDYDGSITKFEWDMDFDPLNGYEYDSGTDPTLQMTYNTAATMTQWVRVTDDEGNTGEAFFKVAVSDPGGNMPPIAGLLPDTYIAEAPADVTWHAEDSHDLDGSIVKFEWDMDQDPTGFEYDSGTSPQLSMQYTTGGKKTQWVRVTDDGGATDTACATVMIEGMQPLNEPPRSLFTVTPNEGNPGLIVQFDGSSSYDPDGTIQSYDWDFDGDLMIDSTTTIPTTVAAYAVAGIFDARLTVTDDQGVSDTTSQRITIHGWQVTTVDDSADTGEWCSAAVVDGYPAVAYFEVTRGAAMYVRAVDSAGSVWSAPVTLDTGTTGNPGVYSSLGVIGGSPAVAYTALFDERLFYMRALDQTGENWPAAPKVVDDSEQLSTVGDIAMVEGMPAICYTVDTTPGSAGGDELRFIRSQDGEGVSWAAPTSVAGWGHCARMLPVGSPQVPGIAHVSDGSILYFERALNPEGSGWAAQATVSGLGDIPDPYLDMALVAGSPTVCYIGNDITTNPGLFIQQSSSTDGTSWIIGKTRVDSDTMMQTAPSLAVADGNPAIAYFTSGMAGGIDLKYIRSDDAGGYVWSGPETVQNINAGSSFLSMVVINGHPGIAFTDYPGSAPVLRFAYLY